MVTQITPLQAQDKLDREGYLYLDVRSVGEFELGHPAGAYNVPIMHRGAGGMTPNTSFLSLVSATFPKDTKLVIGCKMGGRSKRAAQVLSQAGFSDLLDLTAGFDGKKDPFGGLVEPGWKPTGLPIAIEAEPGRSFAELTAALAG